MRLYSVLLYYIFISTAVGIDSVHVLNSATEAEIRENVVILCKFTVTSVDTNSSLSIHWHRIKENKIVAVHSYYGGDDRLHDQDPEFRDRSHLFHSELPHGNASLMLSGVKLSDSGTFRCIISDQKKTAFDEGILKVHAKPSVPVITMLQENGRTVLQCKTASSDPQTRIMWHSGKAFEKQQDTAIAMTTEGLFTIQSNFSLGSSIEEIMCCSAVSVITAKPVQSCVWKRLNDQKTLLAVIIPSLIFLLYVILIYFCKKLLSYD